MILKYSYNEFDTNLHNDKIIILDFFSNNCPTCKALNSILEEVDKFMFDNIIVLKINVHEEEYLKSKFNILSTPKMYFINKGNIVGIKNGIVSKDELTLYINSLKTKTNQ